MLQPILQSETIDRIYLDGVDVSGQTFESLIRLESVTMISIVGTKVDNELVEKLQLEFPDKEIYVK